MGGTGLVVKLPANIVVNELLCLVQNKVEQLPLDALAQLFADLYKVDGVVAAMQLFYNSVPTKSRQVFRKGANKSKISMSDIVNIFLEMEVTNAPIFLARLDSLKVIQETEAMKSQIIYVTNSQLELVKLVKSCAISTNSSRCTGDEKSVDQKEPDADEWDPNRDLLAGNYDRNDESTDSDIGCDATDGSDGSLSDSSTKSVSIQL